MVTQGLIVVDVQRDFCVGGALAAFDTPSLIEPLAKFVRKARVGGSLIVFTQDWHPADHMSFKQNGGAWPTHCEAGSVGASLMSPLAVFPEDIVVHKGAVRDSLGYSAFESTHLEHQLHTSGVRSLGICGIATEYCVRSTALDARHLGFEVTVLKDLIRPVDPVHVDGVILELSQAQIHIRTSQSWASLLRQQ